MIGDNAFLIVALAQLYHLVIIEFIPVFPVLLVFSNSRIMATIQSTGMEDYCEKVIDLIIQDLLVLLNLFWGKAFVINICT